MDFGDQGKDLMDMTDGLLVRTERGRLAAGGNYKKFKKKTRGGVETRQERQRSVVRGGGEVWQNGPRGTRPPNWYLNTRAEQNCCYHKKLMN